MLLLLPHSGTACRLMSVRRNPSNPLNHVKKPTSLSLRSKQLSF